MPIDGPVDNMALEPTDTPATLILTEKQWVGLYLLAAQGLLRVSEEPAVVKEILLVMEGLRAMQEMAKQIPPLQR